MLSILSRLSVKIWLLRCWLALLCIEIVIAFSGRGGLGVIIFIGLRSAVLYPSIWCKFRSDTPAMFEDSTSRAFHPVSSFYMPAIPTELFLESKKPALASIAFDAWGLTECGLPPPRIGYTSDTPGLDALIHFETSFSIIANFLFSFKCDECKSFWKNISIKDY